MSDQPPILPVPETDVFRCVHGARDAGAARILMVGELDLAAAPYARAAIRRAQEESGDVVCDLGYVSFLDLAGLQVLIDAAAHARQHATRLTVANSPPLLPRILGLFRLEGCIELEGDPATAAPPARDQPGAPGERAEHKRALRQTPGTRAHGEHVAGARSSHRLRDH